MSSEFYPFGDQGYKIKKGKNVKKALSTEQKNQLLVYSPNSDKEQEAWDYFVFSYFCNGMNFADIAKIQRKHITERSILFYRQKTDSEIIEIPLRKEIREIILRRGVHDLSPHAFVFPIYTHNMSAQDKLEKKKEWIKKTNEELEIISKNLNFPFKLTTYHARHTFATVALRNGAPKEFIQKALGHTSMNTTENYLADLEFDVKKAVSDGL